jgi:hypothetical protein
VGAQKPLSSTYEWLDKLKIVFTASGLEPATFRLLAQCLIHYEVEVTLRMTVSQILLPVGILLSEIWGLLSVGHPLWREDGSAICSVITQWCELLKTRNHTLLSYLRLPQPGGPSILQEQGGPLRGSRLLYDWRSVGRSVNQSVSQYVCDQSRSRSYFTTDSQSVSQSVCLGIEKQPKPFLLLLRD